MPSGTKTQGKVPGTHQSVRAQAGKELAKDITYKGAKAGVDMITGLGDSIVSVAKGKPITAAVKAGKSIFNAGKHAAKIGSDLFRILFNHDKWYLNYDAAKMVNANYGINKNVSLQNIMGQGDSSALLVVNLRLALVIPNTQANEWRQGIQIIYNTLRAANSGAINYTVYDVEKYVLAIRSLHAAYYTLRRAYATLNNVDRYDSSTPASLFAAMGLDFVSFSENAANLRMFGNKLSTTISRLYPLKLDLIERTDWLFSNFFADSNDAKKTVYVFSADSTNYAVPGRPTSGNEVVGLGTSVLSSTLTGALYSNIILGIQTMLNKLNSSNTTQVIAGDILKAFGKESIMREEIWDDRMDVPVVYDEAALTQIQNTDIVHCSGIGYLDVANDWDTMGSNSWVLNKTIDLIPNHLNAGLINMYKDVVEPGDTLSATRLKVTCSYDSGTNTVTLDSWGTEVCTRMTLIYTSAASTNYAKLNSRDVVGDYVSGGTTIIYTASKLVQAAYHPAVCIGDTSNPPEYLLDLNNYALAGKDNIDAFHGYCVFSLLYVPYISRFSKTELYG